MRTREEIIEQIIKRNVWRGNNPLLLNDIEYYQLEVLLDIRDALSEPKVSIKGQLKQYPVSNEKGEE